MIALTETTFLMKKTTFIIAVLLLLLISRPSSALEFKHGIGVGIQYGGIVGWQGSLNSEHSKTRLSLGYAGFTLGHERYLGSNFSLGGQAFLNQYVIGIGLNLNYYFSTHSRKGWLIGLDANRGYVSSEAGLELISNYFEYIFDTNDSGINAKLNNRALVSIGYQF